MKSVPRLGVEHYTTAHLAPHERHEAWLNRHWPSLAPIFETRPLEPFNTSSDGLQLGTLAIHYAEITAQRWQRDAGMLRSHNPDSLNVAITVSGEAHGLAGETSFRTGPGSVHLGDLAQTSLHDSTASRTILLSVPRPVAAARGLDVRRLHGVVLNSAAAAMLGPHLLAIRHALPEMTQTEVPLAERTVLDLLCLAITTSGRAERPVTIAARTAALAARREIEALLDSPGLTIANLCRRLSLSRTSLYRLFEKEGGVQAYVRERRLEAVRRALADPANPEPIFALAERYGFADAAHLSRLFRTRYGLSPRDYRALSATSDRP